MKEIPCPRFRLHQRRREPRGLWKESQPKRTRRRSVFFDCLRHQQNPKRQRIMHLAWLGFFWILVLFFGWQLSAEDQAFRTTMPSSFSQIPSFVHFEHQQQQQQFHSGSATVQAANQSHVSISYRLYYPQHPHQHGLDSQPNRSARSNRLASKAIGFRRIPAAAPIHSNNS